jgi:hypothetical protein
MGNLLTMLNPGDFSNSFNVTLPPVSTATVAPPLFPPYGE